MTRPSDPEWRDQVWRRWERRRNLPFRQFDAAIDQLKDDIGKSALWRLVGRVLNR